MKLMLVAGLLAQDQPRDTGPEFGKASPFGLLVLVLLLIGTFLLVWSMNRHLRKLPKSFEPQNPDPDPTAESPTEPEPQSKPEAPPDGTKREPGG
jgi:hypothetical protein